MNLYKGQIFKSSIEIAKAIDYKKTVRRDMVEKELGHYCVFHRDGTKVIIDDIFEKSVPFAIRDYTHEVGQKEENEFGKFIILERYMKFPYNSSTHKVRMYKCQCLTDPTHKVFELTNTAINDKKGCPQCGRNRIRKGNNLYNARPDLIPYLANPEDAKKYAPNATAYILCKCPFCLAEKQVSINNLYGHGFSCSNCGDGFSYPNKFVNNFLDQVQVNHTPEKTFKWSKNKEYDQYLSRFNTIIENHGRQHYDEGACFPGISLKEQKENDKLKKELALKNGIEHYVVLNCSVSTMERIKNSIMDSILPSMLGFHEDDVDWEKCHIVANGAIVADAWKLWNEGHGLIYISKELKIGLETTRGYINDGIKKGECQERSNQNGFGELYTKGQMKPIYSRTDDIYFASRFDCEKYYDKLFPSKTGSFMLYKFILANKTYKGKKFEYIAQEFFNQKWEEAKTNKEIHVYGKPFYIES